jgi:hypothetical protein
MQGQAAFGQRYVPGIFWTRNSGTSHSAAGPNHHCRRDNSCSVHLSALLSWSDPPTLFCTKQWHGARIPFTEISLATGQHKVNIVPQKHDLLAMCLYSFHRHHELSMDKIISFTLRHLFPQQKAPVIRCTGDWMGRRAGLDVTKINYLSLTGMKQLSVGLNTEPGWCKSRSKHCD